jgi:hypothetical protein
MRGVLRLALLSLALVLVATPPSVVAMDDEYTGDEVALDEFDDLDLPVEPVDAPAASLSTAPHVPRSIDPHAKVGKTGSSGIVEVFYWYAPPCLRVALSRGSSFLFFLLPFFLLFFSLFFFVAAGFHPFLEICSHA